MKKPLIAIACLALAACATAPDPQAPKVKITPLGSHDGEFCPLDRALVFEDPDGTASCTTPAARCAAPATRVSAGSTRYW